MTGSVGSVENNFRRRHKTRDHLVHGFSAVKTGYTDSQCGGRGRSHESQVPFRGSLNPRTLPDLNLKLHPLSDLFQNVMCLVLLSTY